jgi:FG-GAP repeat
MRVLSGSRRICVFAAKEMVTMRRTTLVVGYLLLVAAAAMVSPASAQPTASSPSDVAADFNHDGFADLAVGVTGENIAAGAVNVLYGAGAGLSGTGAQIFFQVGGAQEERDRFGSAQAAGDFNGDGFADLAAGASGEDVGSVRDAGAVSVLYGSARGLTTTGGRLFTQVGSRAEEQDWFGWALAAGDFNGDGFADLAVGAPSETVGSAFAAGAVSVLYGSAAGLTTTRARLFTQVAGAAEVADEFGRALAAGDFNRDGFADLAAGAPGEGVGSAAGAGAVSVLPGSAGGLTATGARLFTQVGGLIEGGDQFGAALAAGDFNHNGFADLAAGAPSERVGSVPDAGAVSVWSGSTGGLTTNGGRLFTQVGGTAERFDVFGFALAARDFNHDGFADLAASAPLEDVGTVADAGALSVLRGSAAGLTTTGARLFTQVAGSVEAGDEFGEQLASGDFNHDGFADLAAAAPLEDVGAVQQAGAISVLPGSAAGLTATGGRLFTQNSSGVPDTAETGDHFGGMEVVF